MKMSLKKITAAAVMSVMLLSLASCGNKDGETDGDYIYGKVDSVSGNDVVLLTAEYNGDSDSADSKSSDDSSAAESGSQKSKSKGFSRPESGSMPEGFDPSQFGGRKSDGSRSSDDSSRSKRSRPESGEMPEGFDPSQFSGSMPEGFDPSQFSDSMPGGFGKSSDGSGKAVKEGNYTYTGEQQELRIPVGVTVTTSSGVETNFDAVSKGDIIKCRIEKGEDGKDVVTEVWIMEN